MHQIKIGLPRALLYHKYHYFWGEFFSQLGCEVVISPDTNKEILANGLNLAVDESCLSVKIFLGHVNYLKDKVDYVFIPRIVSLRRDEYLCTKFMALPDIVSNTFEDIKVLSYTVDVPNFKFESLGLLRMAVKLNHNPYKIIGAYFKAKQKQGARHQNLLAEQLVKAKSRRAGRPAILVVSHPYTTYDQLFGRPIIKFLEEQGVDLFYSDIVESRQAREYSKNLSKDLYWTYNKEFLGSIEIYKNLVDGIIFLMTFPCGPDSLVINLCQNKIKGLPLAVITLDELQAEAGLKTRLESFVDILKLKKQGRVET